MVRRLVLVALLTAKKKSLSNTGSSQVLLARVGAGVAALVAATSSILVAPLDGGLALALAGRF